MGRDLEVMITNRRQFLVKCSSAALLAGVEATRAFPLLPKGLAHHPRSLSLATFRRHLSSPFRVQRGVAADVVLSLVEAREVPESHQTLRVDGAPRCEAFSLLFVGAKNAPLEQQTYVLEHAVLGRVRIFLVPILIDSETEMGYEAVFNRLVGDETTRELAPRL